MKILSFLTDPPVVIAILEHLELPHTPPPISPARGPPQGDFLLDQTPAFDPTEAEPLPDFVFDQSLPRRLKSPFELLERGLVSQHEDAPAIGVAVLDRPGGIRPGGAVARQRQHPPVGINAGCINRLEDLLEPSRFRPAVLGRGDLEQKFMARVGFFAYLIG